MARGGRDSGRGIQASGRSSDTGRVRKVFLALLLVLPCAVAPALGGALPRLGSREAELVRAGDADTLQVQQPMPLPVRLSELRAAPVLFQGKRVRFVLQYRGLLEEWNPLLSRFGPADHHAIEAWSDDRFTWERRVFEDPCRRLFVRRGTPAARVLSNAASYQRLDVLGVVREVFLDEPWIEIESVVPLDDLVGEGTILHVGRADALLREGRVELAIDQLERAKSAPLPAHARRELDRRIIECHRLVERADTERR